MKEVGRWSCSLSVPTALRCWARRSQCITSHFEEPRVRTLALRDRLSTTWVIGNEWTEDVERLISILNWCNELKARMIPSLLFSNKPRFCLWVHDDWRRAQRMEKYRFFWVQYATHYNALPMRHGHQHSSWKRLMLTSFHGLLSFPICP
jgi:hypothetical protein